MHDDDWSSIKAVAKKHQARGMGTKEKSLSLPVNAGKPNL